MSVPRDPWTDLWLEPPPDPEQLAAAEDDYLRRQLGEPYEWPDSEHQYRVAEARAPKPGVPLRRPTEEGETV